jgi:ATP-dependent DNA ligase
MTEQVQFLVHLSVRAVLDGELVAVGGDGKPDFPLVFEAVLHRRPSIPLTFIAFDVLSVHGASVVQEPYSKRREILEQMRLEGLASLAHTGNLRRRRRTLARGLRARTRRCRREAPLKPLFARGAWLDQNEEPWVLAIRA